MFVAATNVVTVQPKTEPVTAEEVKRNAYVVDSNEDDAFIREELIPTARKMVETLACRSLITQTRVQYYDCIPCPPIFLRYGPVQSVSSFTYTDTTEASQTISSGLYDVDTHRARLDMGYSDSWPTSIDKVNAVAITYVAGYGSNASAVPILYRRAIILLCTHWYENRDQFGCEGGDVCERVLDLIALEGRTLEYA